MNRSLASRLVRGAALAVAYLAAARLSRLCVPPDATSAALWVPGGVSMAGLLLLGPCYWPALAAGVFATQVSLGAAPVSAAVSGVLRALVWAAAAWVLLRRLRVRRGLPRVHDVLAFGAVGGAAALVVGFAGWLAVGRQVRGGGHAAEWAAGTMAGVLVLAPALLAWRTRERPAPPGRGWEMAAMLVLAAVTGELLFGPGQYGAAELPLTYAVFPLIVWAAMRLGTRGAASLSLVFGAVAMARVAQGVPLPFQRQNPEHALLAVQQYLSLVALGGLLLAGLTGDRRRALARERRARRQAERVARRQAFLAGLGPVLSGSLEYAPTMAAVARLCVPELGDGCIVDELRDDGTVGEVATLHRHEPLAASLQALRRAYPPALNPNSRVAEVCRTRLPLLVRDAGAGFIRALAVDAAHERLLRALEPRSLLFVPMVAGDRVEGVITLLRTGAGAAPYGPADLALAREVAARAALYLQNARLYRGARAESLVRKRVVSMVAHEVRSPLASILLNAGAVLDGSLPTQGEAGRKPLRSIIVSAEQLSRLVQDLADVTRLEAGDLTVESRLFSPRALVNEARLMLEPLAASAGIRSEWVVAGEPGAVRGDRERVLQVLSNLVANARRHTPRDGCIRVRVEPLHGEARFEVADTGTGIDPVRLETLLAPLWSDTSRGRGMGLPLSRAIVEAQGGRLWAESRPGEGSRFFFTLPLAEAPTPAPALPFAAIRHPVAP
ncbi:MAG TPA: MASE1 domain-containing protein [Longimicrobium sp.]|nr:MASE1 domain-containing protein [Longimicrobium sp.]